VLKPDAGSVSTRNPETFFLRMIVVLFFAASLILSAPVSQVSLRRAGSAFSFGLALGLALALALGFAFTLLLLAFLFLASAGGAPPWLASSLITAAGLFSIDQLELAPSSRCRPADVQLDICCSPRAIEECGDHLEHFSTPTSAKNLPPGAVWRATASFCMPHPPSGILGSALAVRVALWRGAGDSRSARRRASLPWVGGHDGGSWSKSMHHGAIHRPPVGSAAVVFWFVYAVSHVCVPFARRRPRYNVFSTTDSGSAGFGDFPP